MTASGYFEGIECRKVYRLLQFPDCSALPFVEKNQAKIGFSVKEAAKMIETA